MPRLRSSNWRCRAIINRQDITEDADPLTPAFGFTADATFNHVDVAAGDDAEIEAGIEDVEVELEQEQEDIDQENESRQVGVADAQSYADDVDVEQSGFLSAAADGVKASSEADANADLDQLALQDNNNAQTAATSLAFTASPAFTNVESPGRCRRSAAAAEVRRSAEIEAGIEDVEVSVDQDQEDIDQSNKSEQVGPWNDDAEDWGPALCDRHVRIRCGVGEADRHAVCGRHRHRRRNQRLMPRPTLQQVAGQSNANSQSATTTGTFTATPSFTNVTVGQCHAPLSACAAAEEATSKPGLRTSRLRSSRSRRTSIRRTMATSLAWLTR